jgi:hypothetical protein
MIERAVLQKAGLFNETRYYPEEWELYLKIALNGFEFGYLDRDLVIVENREHMDLPLERQWEIKVAAVEMFRRLFPSPVTVNGKVYDATSTIRSLNLRLVFGYLIVRRRDDFLRTLRELYPRSGLLRDLIARCLYLLPPALIKKMWLLYRRRNSVRVRSENISVSAAPALDR